MVTVLTNKLSNNPPQSVSKKYLVNVINSEGVILEFLLVYVKLKLTFRTEKKKKNIMFLVF